MASSLHLCALPSPPTVSLAHRQLHHPPSLVVSISAFVGNHSLFGQLQSRAEWRGRRLRTASGDEAEAGEGSLQDEGVQFDITRLEQYTERVKNEVLRVHAVVDGEEDQVLIFKGFSSSLMRSTSYDPAEPVLPSTATIRAIDRIRGPFNPSKVLLIKGGRGLSWQQFQTLLEERGV